MRAYEERAWLYDAAFSWDITAEVDWLMERLDGPASLLEPGCGSARVLLPFAQRGVEVVGLDRSPTMLERGRERFREAGLDVPTLVEGDMARFDLERRFDAVICPVSSIAYLTTNGAAAAHLDSVARHLDAGSRYFVQLGLRNLHPFTPMEPGPNTQWEMDNPRGRVRCSWFGTDFDPETCIETEISRYEVLTGPEAGAVHEDMHAMRVWDWQTWSDLIAESPFRQRAAYDGNHKERPEVPLGPDLEEQLLIWHELEKEA